MTAGAVPFALAVEGASGPIDSSVMALFPDEKIKLAASDYLMREGELTGAEYFAIKRGIPHLLVGAENEKYYTVHRDLFRKTLADREEMVKTLKSLQQDINELPRYVFHKNKALWDFQKQCEAYDKAKYQRTILFQCSYRSTRVSAYRRTIRRHARTPTRRHRRYNAISPRSRHLPPIPVSARWTKSAQPPPNF